jgi:hypothetical protein
MARKSQIDLAIVRAMEIPMSMITSCATFSVPAGDYIDKLRQYKLWPMVVQCQAKSISAIFQQVSDMPELGPISCGKSYCSACKSICFGERLRKEIEKISGIKRGLCLDCVKALGKSSVERDCRLCIPKL